MSSFSVRFLIVPLATVAAIAVLSTQAASQATTRVHSAAAAPIAEQLVDCTQANRNTVDICLIAETVAH